MQRMMKAIAAMMLMIAVTLFAVGCKPDNDSDVRVTTYTPQDITTTTALCGGDVIVTQGLAINELGICWSTERNPTIEDTCLSTTTWNQTFVRIITGLEPGTVYHVRAFALRGLEYYYGEDMKFTTLGGELPTVTTSAVSNITPSTAMCGGDVVSDGGLPVIERGLCWSTNNNPTITDSHVVMGSGTGSFTTTLNGLSANTSYHVRAFAVNSRGIAYGSDETFITLPGGGGGLNGHDYVDLGLPSGTLWATCNVGATTPEGYGDYFAWGETQPKDYYAWSTYKYCNGNYDQLTKYCSNSYYGYNGFTDNLTVLQPSDDAATANWGNDWRMPTLEEWQELLSNTTVTWTTQNGVNGRLFTASFGQSLFLPAAGYRWDDELRYVGYLGNYWSSTLCTSGPYGVWSFYFGSGGCSMDDDRRRRGGLSVRAVRSARQN